MMIVSEPPQVGRSTQNRPQIVYSLKLGLRLMNDGISNRYQYSFRNL